MLARWHDFVFGRSKDPVTDLYGFLFRPQAAYGSLALILLLAALPANGLGITVCVFRYFTGLPCPGCGLTRSFSSILHLHFAQAYDFHPFGYLLLPLFALIASQSFLPFQVRSGVERLVQTHGKMIRRTYMTLIYGFMAFGIVRIAVYAIQGL